MNQLTVYFLSFAAMIMTLSCDQKDADTTASTQKAKVEKPEPYRTEKVEVFIEKNHTHYMGQIISSEKFQVPSEVNGVLIERKVQAGQPVRKGQSLGVIKPLARGIGSKDYQIISPAKGILGLWLIEEGAVVNSPKAVLTVYNPNKLKTIINVTEEDRLKLLNQRASITLSAKLSISQKPIETSFKVISIGSIIDSTTMTFPVELAIKHNSPRDLTPGSWMTINIDQEQPEKFKVSRKALKQINGKHHIAILDQQSKVNWAPVTVGKKLKDKIIILSGVNKDTVVVISEDKELKQGQIIKTQKG